MNWLALRRTGTRSLSLGHHHGPTMRDHTSLHAWQEANAVTLLVIRLLQTAWKPYGSALFYQLQRSALSVQLNVAEGYTYGDSPSFTKHLGVAYGSAVETGELLRLLSDACIVEPTKLAEVRHRNARSQRLILGLLKRRRVLRRCPGDPVHRLPFTVHAFWLAPLPASSVLAWCSRIDLTRRPSISNTSKVKGPAETRSPGLGSRPNWPKR